MTRGMLARILCRKMRAARYISHCYRLYRFRKYINELLNVYGNSKKLPDYGKSLTWPEPPLYLRSEHHTINILKRMYAQWRAYMVLKPFPKEDWPQMQLKVIAVEALRGRKTDWGHDKRWDGNYLSMKSENEYWCEFENACRNLSKDSFEKVLFSSYIRKVNKFNKTADRVLVVTNRNIYKLDMKNFKSLKSYPIVELSSISVSPGSDQLVMLHRERGDDFIFTLLNFNGQCHNINRVGELIAVLLHRFSL